MKPSICARNESFDGNQYNGIDCSIQRSAFDKTCKRLDSRLSCYDYYVYEIKNTCIHIDTVVVVVVVAIVNIMSLSMYLKTYVNNVNVCQNEMGLTLQTSNVILYIWCRNMIYIHREHESKIAGYIDR